MITNKPDGVDYSHIPTGHTLTAAATPIMGGNNGRAITAETDSKTVSTNGSNGGPPHVDSIETRLLKTPDPEANLMLIETAVPGGDRRRYVNQWVALVAALVLEDEDNVTRDNLVKKGARVFGCKRKTLDGLITKARQAQRKAERATDAPAPDAAPLYSGDVPEYDAMPGGLAVTYRGKEEDHTLALTNFHATVVTDIEKQDGTEPEHFLEIEARLARPSAPTTRFTIAATELRELRWVPGRLGAGAIIYPGEGRGPTHTHAAIQETSLLHHGGVIPKRTVYVHTGWTMHNGEHVYLHAGGAIGASGAVEDIEVELDDAFSRYVLPSPPTGEALIRAIRASLSLLEIGPDRIMIPLFAMPYRAAMGATNFSGHLAGSTGVGKTTGMALVQQHYGATMDLDNLPGSWLSTGNSLEAMAFIGKDTLLCIDDFSPAAGGPYDAQRANREADRVFRGAANSQGRRRMKPDGSLRPPKRARGLILSSGEVIPKGKSLRARLVVLEVQEGDFDWKRITACQADADAGLFAQSMAGFVQFLAPDSARLKDDLRQKIVKAHREATHSAAHRRTPDAVATLLVGITKFIEYACHAGALTWDEGVCLRNRAWKAFGEMAEGQRVTLEATDPVWRFRDYLRAALTVGGGAHLANRDGGAPLGEMGGIEYSLGWLNGGTPQGVRIGWVDIDKGALYLEPELAYTVAQDMARRSNDPLMISNEGLRKELDGKGLLLGKRDEHLKARPVLEGKRRAVLYLPLSFLVDEPEGEPDGAA